MLRALHLAGASILLVSHGVFFFRGLYIGRTGKGPKRLDRIARGLAQAFLPVTAFTGLLAFIAKVNRSFLPHPLVGLLPLLVIPVVFAGRLLLKKKTQAPWLLPALNLGLILAALITGLAVERG